MRQHALRLLSAGLLMWLPSAAPAAPSSKEASREIEAKVALESSLEKRLQAVLREALGSEDLIVIVNVALRSEAAPEDSEVMPGVPLKQTQSPEALADPASLTMPMVSRLSATIMVDQSLEAKDVDLITKVATGILGISAARGDALNVEKIKFHKPHAQPDPLRFAVPAASALWLLFAIIALVVFHRKFLAPLLVNLRDITATAMMREHAPSASADDKDGAENEPAAKAGAASQASPAHANGSRPNRPFSFIEQHDLPKLVYILRHTGIAEATTIIQYLPPDIAAKALAELEPGARRQVVGLLSKVTQLDASQVLAVEESLKKRIDFLIGGEDKLVDLLDSLPVSMQNDLIGGLRADSPSLAEAVSKRLVFIDDIAALEAGEIKLLSRRVPAKLLAVLMRASPALRESVLPKLARGTREWLTQEIEFSPEPTPEALESARRPVLAAVSQLVREGRIVLRKKTPASSAPPGAPAAAPPPPPPRGPGA
ncbi:MAG: hypothetical protein HYZ74_08720 [Elusimicrobia bacterium]|nr:hypothetical protein [Elusimicrobiota bacterium]